MATATSPQTGRKFIDCSEYPSEKDCTLKLSGTEEEVLAAARSHAIAVHGYEDTPDLNDKLRGMIKDE
jgi:hypothetical protein